MADEYDEKKIQMQIAGIFLQKLRQLQKPFHPSVFDVAEYRKVMDKFPVSAKELEKMTDGELKDFLEEHAIAYATAYTILKTVRYFLYHEALVQDSEQKSE